MDMVGELRDPVGLVKRLMHDYEYKMKPLADPRTKNWLLLSGSPIYVWMLTATYLLFVWLGPKVMRHREPLNLKALMFVYNIGCVALSFYMLYELVDGSIDAGYNMIGCAKYNKESITNPKETRIANAMWWYFFSKAIELNDTVLMVLRKRNRQISFLHVFHHATMLNIWWWVCTFIPGGLSFFGSALNCLVHVAMYSYYGLSVIPALKNNLWWKHYITRFQLIQFCCTLSHTLYSLTQPCDFPTWGQYLLASYMVLMLILFTNFYVRSYILKTKSKQQQQKGKRSQRTKLD